MKQGGGSIITNSSIAALFSSYAIFSYRAAKSGVANFSRSLAIDLGEYGIRVSAIAPGHIPTNLGAFTAPGSRVRSSRWMAA